MNKADIFPQEKLFRWIGQLMKARRKEGQNKLAAQLTPGKYLSVWRTSSALFNGFFSARKREKYDLHDFPAFLISAQVESNMGGCRYPSKKKRSISAEALGPLESV